MVAHQQIVVVVTCLELGNTVYVLNAEVLSQSQHYQLPSTK